MTLMREQVLLVVPWQPSGGAVTQRILGDGINESAGEIAAEARGPIEAG